MNRNASKKLSQRGKKNRIAIKSFPERKNEQKCYKKLPQRGRRNRNAIKSFPREEK